MTAKKKYKENGEEEENNILKFIDSFKDSNTFYLVTEYCNMGTLEAYRKRCPKSCLSETEIRYVFKQLINGYKFLSDNKYMHRDLKPENILIIDPYSEDECLRVE